MEGKQIPEELILQAEIPNHPNQNNMKILRNFNAGLKQRGRPSYKEDYSKLD